LTGVGGSITVQEGTADRGKIEPGGAEMKLETIGETAGKIWKHLGDNGSSSVRNLAKSVGTDATSAQLAVGWLAREGKIRLDQKGAQIMVALTEEEARVFEREKIGQARR
jgi:hypothetical protein